MAIREIISVPDPRLKRVSAPVAQVDDAVRRLMDDMVETMHHASGIGLAAVQIGEPVRVIVMDLSPSGDADKPDRYDLSRWENEGVRYFVNPEIIWVSEETSLYTEGCLSVPGFYDDVERPTKCKLRYLDYDGVQQELMCEELLATCIQHEIDHLNGIVFLDHLSRLKRDRITRKLRKQDKEQGKEQGKTQDKMPMAAQRHKG